MLNLFRAPLGRITGPVGRWLVARGVSPDAVTVAGTVGTAVAAVVFIARGQLFLGALLVTVFVLFDMIDGAMARARGFSTPFGAVLDSVCDRIADGVLFAAIAWWCLVSGPGGARRRGTGLPGRGAGDLVREGARRGRGAHRGRRSRRAPRAPDRVAGRHRLRGARHPVLPGRGAVAARGRLGVDGRAADRRRPPVGPRAWTCGGRPRDRPGPGCRGRRAAAGPSGPDAGRGARRLRGLAGRSSARPRIRRPARAACRGAGPVDRRARRPGRCSRTGPRPRRGAHRRRVRGRLAGRPRSARTRRRRSVPAGRRPRRPPRRPRGAAAAGEPAPGRPRRRPGRAGRPGEGRDAQLRPLLVRGVPAALDGPRRRARPDGFARHGDDVRGAGAGPRRRRGPAAQRQLGHRRAVVRRRRKPGWGALPGSPRSSSGCGPSRSSAGSWPTGRASASRCWPQATGPWSTGRSCSGCAKAAWSASSRTAT